MPLTKEQGEILLNLEPLVPLKQFFLIDSWFGYPFGLVFVNLQWFDS
jgi:hypothetical protein